MQPGIGASGAGGHVEHIDIVAWTLRFLKTAQSRKRTLFTFFCICSAIGAAKYVTAVRLYESHADVLILEQGGSVLEKDRGQQRMLTDQMPNFERVFTSDRVLKQALKDLPSEFRGDFLGLPGDVWLDAFRAKVSAATARRTNVIQVSYRSKDPETAYVVVNVLVSASLEFLNTMHSDSASEALKTLRTELKSTEKDIRAKRARLMQLTRESQVLFGGEEKVINVNYEAIIRLNQDLIAARQASIEANSLLVALERAVKEGRDVQAYVQKLSESLATELMKQASGLSYSDGVTASKLEQQLVDDTAELQRLRTMFGDKNPRILALVKQIDTTKQYLVMRQDAVSQTSWQQTRDVLGPRLLEIARQRAALAEAHEAELTRELEEKQQEASGTNQQVLEIQTLEYDINRLLDFHKTLVDRMKDLDLGKTSGVRAKQISDPRINRNPVSPKLSIIMLLTLVGGLGSGLIAVYVTDLIDDRFRSPDDLRSQLGAPILAMVRKLGSLAPHGLESLYPFARPTSVESEAFRSLRTAIDFSGTDTRCLTISSTEPGDGKTTVMASLAVAFAQAGKRTLAIDGDMRRPGLTKLFNLGQRAGLSTVLKSEKPIEDAIRDLIVRPGLANLDILPAGPRPNNPAELLSTDRLPELIAWAEGRYDQILVDAPPSLAVSDVQIIGRVVDGALLTVRPDRNRRKMVIRAAESLTALGCPLIGIVVNHLNAKQGDEYTYGYGYGYGYSEETRDENSAGHESLARAA